MSVINFGDPKKRNYENGLDNGVAYIEDGPVVPWAGLQQLDDSGASEVKKFYQDGINYLNYVTPRDWSGSLTCVTYPRELSEALGLGAVGDGFYADSQVPTRFSISYRTRVTTPDVDKAQQYKIHLVYKVMATVEGFSNTSVSETVEPRAFQFGLSAVPIVVPLMRPTAHLIFDSREIDSVSMASLQKILYGSSNTSPRLPTIDELVEFLRFSNDVRILDNGDGTWTALGNKTNVTVDADGRFVVNNVTATAPDANGKYTIQVTP